MPHYHCCVGGCDNDSRYPEKRTEERTGYWEFDIALLPLGFKGKSPLGDKHFERTGAL